MCMTLPPHPTWPWTAACTRIPQLMDEELLPTLALLEKQCATYHEYAVTSQVRLGLGLAGARACAGSVMQVRAVMAVQRD